jgi:hypothetical protein
MFAHSQKITVDKVDAFDSTRAIATSFEDIGKSPSLSLMAVIQIKSTDTVRGLIFLSEVPYESVSIDNTSQMSFKTTSLGIMKFNNTAGYKIQTRNGSIELDLRLTSDEMKKLMSTDIESVRVDGLNNVSYELDINPKKKGMLAKMLTMLTAKL